MREFYADIDMMPVEGLSVRNKSVALVMFAVALMAFALVLQFGVAYAQNVTVNATNNATNATAAPYIANYSTANTTAYNNTVFSATPLTSLLASLTANPNPFLLTNTIIDLGQSTVAATEISGVQADHRG